MFVYILTNKNKTTLYVGVTNDLSKRLAEHREARNTFTSKYKCYNLIYFEEFQSPLDAIAREKEIKKWRREKKERLISSLNPHWDFWEF
ncbi:GIY-YIG nuclease family protein [Algoriphagus lutimaris]|uniref:GIY-YIG nuclease family protein n=1 Tax=Algoriphagus lutimaris TaxID=613197 RepID=UPI00196ABD94|nr:GIY-YIG nuclease family protein [Algoriphagus lutimaris]MBN3518754.1 GIY-YIG nuclease family protein [Algoriphagus lutimaris]